MLLFDPGYAEEQTHPGETAIHGMLIILSGDKIYISHLPMFSIPHRFQAIWEVSFGNRNDKRLREHARHQASPTIHTLAPKDTFPLRALLGSKRSFRADVFIGHFERPGHKLLLRNVEVALTRSIYSNQLEPTDSKPTSLTYIVFGDKQDQLLLHKITAPPNYDQVLSVSSVQERFAAVAPLGADGLTLTIPNRSDLNNLSERETVTGLLHRQGDEIGTVTFMINREHYIERNELEHSLLE
jgi:hypothetical protein